MPARFLSSGRFKTYWTKSKIIANAKKYTTRAEWEKNSKSYAAAVYRDLLKDPKVTGHFLNRWERKNAWNKEKIKASANKFNYRSEWRKDKSYKAAQRLGLLFDKDISGHLSSAILSKRKYTKSLVIKSAKKFRFKSEWNKSCDGEYQAAKKYGWYKEATKHMDLMGSRYYRCLYSIKVKNKKIAYIGLTYNFEERIKSHLKTKRFKKFEKKDLIIKRISNYIHKNEAAKLEIKLIEKLSKQNYELLNIKEGGGLGGGVLIWTKDKVLKSAKKFMQTSKWKKGEPGSYSAARKDGYFKEATKHMKYLWKFKWSKENVLKDALKYKTRTDWLRGSNGAYWAANDNGWSKEATAHMVYKGIKWTKEKVLKDALKYKFRRQWALNSGAADAARKRLNCYEEATKHMKKLR